MPSPAGTSHVPKHLTLARIFHTRLDPMHFTESTEPSPQKSQSGQGVWLRDLGSGLCVLWEKDFLQKSVIDAP